MSGRRATQRDHRGAFTLLEVLLALSLMSVLAVSLFTSLHAAFKSKRLAEASLDTIRGGEAAMELIRADLESALPPRGTLAGTFLGRDWAGENGVDDDDVSFPSAAPTPPGVYSLSDIKNVTLTMLTLSDTGERVLARRVDSNLLANIRTVPDDEILCRGITSFNLRYYDGFGWWNDWDSELSEDSLPLAIEVTLELRPPGSRESSGESVPLRFTRIVQLPCAGEVDRSEIDTPADPSGASGTPTGNDPGMGRQ